MPIEGVTVTKIIEPQQLGVHNDKIIYGLLCTKQYTMQEIKKTDKINES